MKTLPLLAFLALSSRLALAQAAAPETPPSEPTPAAASSPADAPPVVTTPAAAAAVEQKALEADMAAGHRAVEAQQAGTPSESGTTTPAGFEEVHAAPVLEQREGMPVAEAIIKSEDFIDAKSGFGLHAVVENSVGTGTFIENDALREKKEYAALTLDVTPSYGFTVGDHNLRLSARFVLEVEYTEPDTDPARRVKPSDTRLTLSDANIFTESVTGVTLDGYVRFTLPTSYESINVKKQWGAASAGIGLSRSFGPIDVGWTLGATKYLNSEKVATQTQYQRGITGASTPEEIQAGAANRNFLISNYLAVAYNMNEVFSVSYGLFFLNYFSYGVGKDDEYQSANADNGVGRSDQLWPTLEANVALSNMMGDALASLPFKLDVAAGITALHPAQTADNSSIIWPVFVQSFGSNRAADNYGSIYLDIKGTY